VLGSADLRDDPLTRRLLARFHEAGGRALDLANVYADGESERAIGRWLAASGADLTLYVKGCHPPYCSPSLVESEVDKARSELGLDALDVFILHRDDQAVPVAAFADALLRQVAAGSIRSFGVSNWTLERFHELSAELGADARHLVVFSNHFSLVEMVTPTWPGCLAMGLDDVAALARARVTALAWASLAAGYFARRDSPSWASGENDRRRRRAEQLAAERDTSATAIALSYVLHQPAHVLAAVGTRSETHLDELLQAATIELAPSEVDWLRDGRETEPRAESAP
jgi:aryl-alcohol dehydrogenase-like predicted oxidoreductase